MIANIILHNTRKYSCIYICPLQKSALIFFYCWLFVVALVFIRSFWRWQRVFTGPSVYLYWHPREEALGLYTTSAAQATFEEDIKGSIETGKLADFVVISDDFFTVDAEKIKDNTIVKTVVGGKAAYEK